MPILMLTARAETQDVVGRAAAMTGLIVALDALVVAPLFERSYAMFRSALGTWIPFAAIFLASWAAGRTAAIRKHRMSNRLYAA